jgi:hypothetical protein
MQSKAVNGYSLPYGLSENGNQIVYSSPSMGQSMGVSMGQSMGMSMGLSMGQSMGLSMGQSMGLSMGQSMGQSMGLSMGQSMGLSMGQSMGFNAINLPYGNCLLPSDARHRQGIPGTDIFGNGVDYSQCVPLVIKPASVIGPQNTQSVNQLDKQFLGNNYSPMGISEYWKETFTSPDLQTKRPDETKPNSYISLAANSLHAAPDTLMNVFFSDLNIKHIRDTVVKKVKEITAESGVGGTPDGVDIKPPNMDDLFYYMVNVYQNYKINNGSICFVNIKKGTDVKNELYKLNSDVLQDYTSKMVSQIDMYIYYYLDASQLPEQLGLPTYNSMKGSRSLEYNNGFSSGNSIGVASYNESTNIF